MLDEIKNVLKEHPGLTGREIGRKIDKKKSEVNSFLSKSSEGLFQEDWKWYIKPSDEIVFHISCDSWLTCDEFEDNYSLIGELLNTKESRIIVVFPKNFSVLLVAGARMISLINQLNHKGKFVSLNFEKCKKSMGYLNRLGFFNHINENVDSTPPRPKNLELSNIRVIARVLSKLVILT